MKPTHTAKAYNALVDYINELVDRGYEIDERHDNQMGYGFYIEKGDGDYINIFICNMYYFFEYCITLTKHNSRFAHDTVNDIEKSEARVKTELDDDFLDKIKEAVEGMLKK